MTESLLKYSVLLGGKYGTDGDRDDARCFVEAQFGENNGLEMIALNEWQESYSHRSVELAKKVLKSTGAPKESVEWAKNILGIK